MRSIAFVPVFAACSADPADCGPSEEEVDGTCVAARTDTDDPPPVEVGNDVDLGRYPPVIIAVTPVSGSLEVDVGLAGMSVTFSKAMALDRWSWVSTSYDFPAFSDATEIAFTDDRTNTVN